MRYALPLLVFLVLVAFLASGLYRDPRSIPSPLIGRPAPELGLPLLSDASKCITRADLLGQVTLVNVWASWCAACREEHEVLLHLAREGGLTIVGFNYKDRRDEALQWLQTLGNPYRIVAFDVDGRVGIDWGVYGVPESFLIDTQGIIRYKHLGPLSWRVVEETLMPMVQSLQSGGG